MEVFPPDYPNYTGSLSDVREKLNGTTSDVGIQVGGGERRKLRGIGVIYRNSKMGATFQARRNHQTPSGVSELPQLCQKLPRCFVGGSPSSA